MNAPKCGYWILLLATAAASPCIAQELENEFTAALESVATQSNQNRNRLDFADMQNAADSFCKRFTSRDTVQFLRTKVSEENSRKLALLCLAKLATVDSFARQVLFEVISTEYPRGIVAVGYLDPSGGRPVAQMLVQGELKVFDRRTTVRINHFHARSSANQYHLDTTAILRHCLSPCQPNSPTPPNRFGPMLKFGA